ncbi:Arc family DNA-binding protein, partial [Acinetobacter baumannii]
IESKCYYWSIINMRTTKQLNLRLPEELVFWVKKMAKKRHQSMNSYVLTELERMKKESKNELN